MNSAALMGLYSTLGLSYNIYMSKNWIENAISSPGSLHRSLGVAVGEKIPAKKLNKAASSGSPLEKKRAILAKTLSRFHK